MGRILVGCAGWTIPKAAAEGFSAPGTHLQRYASRLPAVEINSSFYRPHRPETYARWAQCVPDDFRFSVKVPKKITHELRLKSSDAELEAFVAQASNLEAKLGCLLVQLPPSLQWEQQVAERFFQSVRELTPVAVVCEPRHATWFSREADELLVRYRVARVAADPAPAPAAGGPGGGRDVTYFRLHGSPRTYYSSYNSEYLAALAGKLNACRGPAWCIFDNTALGAATENALELVDRLTAARS